MGQYARLPLKLLEGAKLVSIKDGSISLAEFGADFMQERAEKTTGSSSISSARISDAKQREVTEIRPLLPYIADSSKFRVIAKFSPPLGGALKVLEPLFPRGRYSVEDRGAHNPEGKYTHHPILLQATSP